MVERVFPALASVLQFLMSVKVRSNVQKTTKLYVVRYNSECKYGKTVPIYIKCLPKIYTKYFCCNKIVCVYISVETLRYNSVQDNIWRPITTFMCDRGRHHNVNRFCNGKVECADGSDEIYGRFVT